MKKNLLFAIALISVSYCSAQYTLSTFTSEYMPIENGIVPSGVSEGWDDPLFETPFGFDLTMGSITVNTVQQDGLGAYLLAGTFDDGALFGYLGDIIDGAEIEGQAPSEITYSVSGSEGNRICKIQYSNAAFYAEVIDNGSAANRTNFQIWFYESDFSLEIRFGVSNISNAILAYEGLSGPTIGLFTGITDDGENVNYAVVLSGDPSSPTLQEVTAEDDPFFEGLNGTPENGRVYRFTPQQLSSENVEEDEYSVFPSPATDFIQIDGKFKSGESFRITDISGRVVSQGVFTENTPIDVSGLTGGIYLISFVNSRAVGKFLKK